MEKDKESIVFILLLFLLLPYLITAVCSGREACPVFREVSLEEYVPVITASQISWDASEEAVKAQTILARGNLYLAWEKGRQEEILIKASENLKKREMDGEALKKYQKFQEAETQTEGMVLTLEGKAIELPYHALSQGKTRDGKEILGEEYGYLPSVDAKEDTLSPFYVQGCYFSYEELEKKIKDRYPGFSAGDGMGAEVLSSDSAGYALEVRIGEQEFQGEEIRELLSLPSSCFTIQTLGEKIRFLCKGQGHGLGMSQYTADKMAEEGKGYEEILAYFFPELILEKAEAPET